MEHYNLLRLQACRDIAAGKELCIPYLSSHMVATAERRRQLRANWGFDCTCAGCSDPALAAQLDKLLELHDAIPELMQRPQTLHMALTAGLELLQLFATLQSSSTAEAHVLHDLYQVAVRMPGMLWTSLRRLCSMGNLRMRKKTQWLWCTRKRLLWPGQRVGC